MPSSLAVEANRPGRSGAIQGKDDAANERRLASARPPREPPDNLTGPIAAFTQAERRFRILVESAPDAMVIVEASGAIRLINSQTERLFGFTPGEIVGQPVERLIPQRFRAVHERHRRAYLAAPRPRPMGAGLELLGLRKDGTEFPIEISLSPIETVGGMWICGAVRDITERKRLEEDLSQHQAELAHMARLATVGEMAAALTHELKQPLTAIATNFDVMQRLVQPAKTPDEQARNLARAEDVLKDVANCITRSDTLLQNLRRFLRKTEPQRVSLDINAAIRQIATVLQADVRMHRATMQLGLTDPLPPGFGDPIQLQQVVLNLVHNALEAMDGAGLRDRTIEIQSGPGNDHGIQISVTDRGPGLPDELRERVFEPWFTTKPQGLGMGLAICRTIVEAHGGTLWCTPNPERGLTFHFTVPPADGVSAVHQAAAPA